ncbi:hypothetical protein HOF56_04465 [Candidatus Peribacteria bacterium]|jgi:hypothetical protein|nr:hypothetical protein [Candidatus Peribacteria bacterium]MBT4021437.1 hypothetical protein [Candidatus Peribacteria bacterium]MBT4240453.1 hypothetical protein [Candidatus Peribacteria bacterium]MBT4474535.1 hypothetical protein [Candidatus Peribacteria bacterium]
MYLNPRHRAFTISLAAIAAGIFMIFVARVYLIGAPEDLRECTYSEYYRNRSLADMQRSYHWSMEKMTEERMDMYEGRELLKCEEEDMKSVIPEGEFSSAIAAQLRSLDAAYGIPDPFTYADFEKLLYEFWRTYDCHLFSIEHNQPLLMETVNGDQNPDVINLISDSVLAAEQIKLERSRARLTYERLMSVIRASEKYLPLHASLRCLQRGSTDIRNAMSIISDASQCLPERFSQPETSLLK